MEYIAQLVRYSRACCSYQEWLDRELWITRNYWTKWFVVIMFNLRLWQFYDRHHDLINRYGLCHRWPLICCVCSSYIPVLQIRNNNNTMYHKWRNYLLLRKRRVHPRFFWCGSRYSIFSFLCIILSTIVGRFVLYLLVSIVSVLWFKASDYIFCIFKHFCDVK
jgi:hypothetical protein